MINIGKSFKLTIELQETDTFCSMQHSPVEGDIVYAKLTDGEWYKIVVKKSTIMWKKRSVVIYCKIEVFFIDYRNSRLFSMENIRIIRFNFSS